MATEEYQKKDKKRFGKFKRYVGCFGCVFVFFAIIAIILTVLTITGHTKSWICDVVTEDSFVADEINCSVAVEDKSLTESEQARLDEIQKLIESGKPEDRIAAVVSLVQKSVVGIGVEGDSFTTGGIVGTGFIISEDGLIVTNQHVVSEQNVDYFVQVEGMDEVLKVADIYRDPVNDIAVVKVENADNLTPIVIGDSDELKVGQQVIAIGNPLGELSGTVTSGIISGLGRSVDISSGGFFNSSVETYEDVIQTDAAINPGNSGGPLIDLNGKVIGINFATVAGADNLSFALPINRIQARIDELNEFGEFRMPFLGVEYRERIVFIDSQMVVAAQVMKVAKDSPAEKGGLAQGDYIIGFDGEDLSEKSLISLIQESEIGDEVTMNIIRDQEEIEVKVVVGTR